MAGRRRRSEELSLSGDQAARVAKGLARAVLARRVTVKTRRGTTLLPVPLFLVLPLVLLLPLWVLVAALAALALGLRIALEGPRREPAGEPSLEPESPVP